MFYLKGGTLIQRHHTSTEKKCCLISVTPLLLLSSSDREGERGYVPLLPHRHPVSWDLTLPQWKIVQIIMDSLGWQWVEHRCLTTKALRASLLIENIMQCKNVPFQMSTMNVFPAGNVAPRHGGKSGKCSTFPFPNAAPNGEGGEIRMKGRRGEETRTDTIWRTLGLPALIPRDWQIGATAAPARMPSHAFPQKSVYQHCLSRATAMTSNHSRAGTS